MVVVLPEPFGPSRPKISPSSISKLKWSNAMNGVMLSEILHSCFCSHYNKTDVEVQQELGVGRTSFYKMKKQALGYLGFYFYEIVVPQAKDKRFKPSLGVEEE